MRRTWPYGAALSPALVAAAVTYRHLCGSCEHSDLVAEHRRIAPVVAIVAAALAWPWIAGRLLTIAGNAGVDRAAALTGVFSGTAALGAAAWLVRRLSPVLRSPTTPVRQWLLVVAATVIASFAGTATQLIETGEADGNGTSTAAVAVVTLIAASTVVPFAEEMIYRGVCYQALRHRAIGGLGRWPEGGARWRPLLPAVAISSVLFGASHYEVANLAGVGTLVLFGAVMAIAYEFTGRLWVPMLAHAAHNLGLSLDAHTDLPALGIGAIPVLLMVALAAWASLATGPPAPRRFIGTGRDLHPFGDAGRRKS